MTQKDLETLNFLEQKTKEYNELIEKETKKGNKVMAYSHCRHFYIPAKHMEVRKIIDEKITISNEDFIILQEGFKKESVLTY